MCSIFIILVYLTCEICRTTSIPTTDNKIDQLQQQTDDLLNQLTDYQTVIPTLVDEQGHFLSYDVRQGNVLRRSRRSTAFSPKSDNSLHQSNPGKWRVFYKLSAYGKEFNFNLTLNLKLLSKNFVVENWYKKGAEKHLDTLYDCHYTGYSSGPYRSRAAISNCMGLHGVFSTDDEDYFVEPLWNTTNTVEEQGYPHIVYSRSSLKFKDKFLHCGVKDHNFEKRQWLYNKSPHIFNEVIKPKGRNRNRFTSKNKSKRRRPRSVSRKRNVEMLVVADKRMVDYHKSKEIAPYVLTVMNIVAKLFHDASIGNSINIIITRLVLLSEDQSGLEISHHADRSLDSFCKWQQTINGPEDRESGNRKGIAHHDNAVLITRFDICTYKNKPCGTLGLAPVAGMCEEDRSCSINEDIGLASAFTIAHEIGHNFGMHHDGAGNPCGTPGYERARIMAAQLTKDTKPFLWSSCSKEYITSFLDSGRGHCLKNVPPQREFKFPEQLAGQRHGSNQQCKLQFGSKSKACNLKNVCTELSCIDKKGECVTNSIPAAEGTTCPLTSKKRGWCYRGQCRPPYFTPRPVDGNWGGWSEWGECSRTCGGGVSASHRNCSNPEARHGGKYCTGERKRYRSCNIVDCPEDAIDFRELQCNNSNNEMFRGRHYIWKPYTGVQVKPCALICMADGYNFYTERNPKVLDGTPCYPDKRDVCISGDCHKVGCDGYLGSSLREDKCRVCGGDGTTCKTISGLFDKPLPKGTYHEIVKIPIGAMNVKITEAVFSRNYLAIKNEGDRYYINGDWTIDWPRKFPLAGTVFHYQREDDKSEILEAIGPTGEALIVMMLMQEENKGVKYEYNLPFNKSYTNHDISLYTWDHSPWSACSRSCAKGLHISTPRCTHKINLNIVSDRYCHPQPRPSDHKKVCNHQPCPPTWTFSNWGECSQSCGGGLQSRSVVCDRLVGEDEPKEVLDDTECLDNKPSVDKTCGEIECPSVWFTDEWSKCRPSCGAGSKTRRAFCMTSDGKTYLEEKKCSLKEKPVTTKVCRNENCPPPEWVKGEWGECSSECGTGHQRRNVQCRSPEGQPSKNCDRRKKPITITTCETKCEDEDDDDECVDKYKVAYCPLVLKFRFCNREYFQKMCCLTCLKHAKRG
ncbi:A disintegrin and metalloproteinase with thrombospondin motifs 6 [Patella vulgata]|uniref:A disintegrin and metalloproteinase with thrombospondin motifs 6 n=1 Tax=Patella vulgata TaxID=6465 RepID=UPI00217F7D6B|nr:A disintegrin and metalloproteinase with thrombospondin motifs 6 [Patella vulgata]